MDINEELVVFLGGPAGDAGILPVGGEERIRQRYGLASDAVLLRCMNIKRELLSIHETNAALSLAEVGTLAAASMRRSRPILSAVVAQKLGNLYAYYMK